MGDFSPNPGSRAQRGYANAHYVISVAGRTGKVALSYTDISGLGTAAVQNTGTSGANVPLLNGANTWSGVQTIGTSASPAFTVNCNTATPNSIASVGEELIVHFAAPDNIVGGVWYDGYGSGFSGMAMRRAEGTCASPTPVLANDILGVITGHGNDGNTNTGQQGYCLQGASQLRFVATENWAASGTTSTNNGSAVELFSTPNGYPAMGNTKLVATFQATSTAAATISVGTAGSVVGSIGLCNATSGVLTLTPGTGALGANVLTLPVATDTIVARATTDTLSNKTLASPIVTGDLMLGAANTPTASLTITTQTGSLPTPSTGAQVHLIAANTANPVIQMNAYGANGTINFAKADGTLGSETALINGDFLGAIIYSGYDGSAYANKRASIQCLAVGNWVSGTNTATEFRFETTQANANAESVAFIIAAGVIVGTGGSDPGTGNLTATGMIKPGVFTVATLPSGVAGARANVSDALAPTFGAAVVGSGTIFTPVYFDGSTSTWKVG